MRTIIALLVSVCIQLSQYGIQAQCTSQGFKQLRDCPTINLNRPDSESFTEIKVDELFTGEALLGGRENRCEKQVAGTLPAECTDSTCLDICALEAQCAHVAYAKEDMCYVFANGDETIFAADDINNVVKKAKSGSMKRGSSSSCADLVLANTDCSSTYVSGYLVCACVPVASANDESCSIASSVASDGLQLFTCTGKTETDDGLIDILIIAGGVAGGLLFLIVGRYLGKSKNRRSKKLKGKKFDMGTNNPMGRKPTPANPGPIAPPRDGNLPPESAVDYLLQQVKQMEKKKSNAQMTPAQLHDLRKFMKAYDTTIISEADLDNKVKLMTKFAVHDVVQALMKCYGAVPDSLQRSGSAMV